MFMSFSEDQLLLRQSVERFVRDSYDNKERSARLQSSEGFSRDTWRRFADLGWIALAVPVQDGGLGGSDLDLMVLMEELGRGLVLEPYTSTAVLAAGLIASAANREQRLELLPDLLAGCSLFALAHAEHTIQRDPFDITTAARAEGNGYRIDGRKVVVLDAPIADQLIIVVRTSGRAGDREGLSLLLIGRDAAGVTRSEYRTLDGRHAADLLLEEVHVPASALLGSPGAAGPLLVHALNRATIATCAEAVGAMSAALSMTRDYVLQRRQFGVPIGSFQVVQHRLADIFMEVELSRSSTWLAAMTATDRPADTSSDVAAARLVVASACRRVAADVIQLHGGIGMTEEYAIGQYSKRLKAIEIWLKSTGENEFVATTSSCSVPA